MQIDNELIARYKVLKEVGHGGMGTVFQAIDTRLGRNVALKLLSGRQTDKPSAWERLIREAALLSTVNHPNVCTIYDLDYDETRKPFIVMEWLDGKTLRHQFEQKRLAVEQVVQLAVQLTEGLEAAHTLGIVHRDIKPANLFLTLRGLVKIIDFGLSALITSTPWEDTLSDISLPGVPIGTVCYMSPEGARGRYVDARTDLFSLGAVLYEAASGRRPFDGSDPIDVIYSILHDEPPPLRELNDDVPIEFERIVQKLLEKSPLRRYSTAGELLSDLRILRAKRLTYSNTRNLRQNPCRGTKQTSDTTCTYLENSNARNALTRLVLGIDNGPVLRGRLYSRFYSAISLVARKAGFGKPSV